MNIILILTIASIMMILAWAIRGEKTEKAIEPQPLSEKEKEKEKENKDEPEKIFRRRSADRKIENEYPIEENPSAPVDENTYDRKNSDHQIELPFSANEIIADGSRFKLYKRALFNSEIYAKRGDIETAISLYTGVKDRILDHDIRDKIESNIYYLNQFRRRREEDLKKKIESVHTPQQQQQQQQEIKLKIEGAVPQTINLTLPEKNLINTDEIVDKISERISNELSNLTESVEDRVKTSNEINKFNEKQEVDLTPENKEIPKNIKEKQEDNLSQEKKEILKDIKEQIGNLSDIKRAIDELQNKIKDVTVPDIPESKKLPTIIQAKYDSPIPIHFDPQPVIDLLDRIDQKRKNEKIEEKAEDTKPVEKNQPAKDLSDDKTSLKNETEPEYGEPPTSEKEVEHHYDGEEDPNEFDLLSDIGKIKDDSTLTDEEIFAKILKDDKQKNNAKDFEIIGETVPEEPEFSSVASIDNSKFNSDQDFYRKFISTDKIKKKELPILKVSYDFKKLPDEFSLSREKNILEYAFYKYKPMLQRADEFLKNKHVKDALNYYKVVLDQNIPIEFKAMLRKNIRDLSEYLEKYLASD